MDMLPKNGSGGLRRVRRNDPRERIKPRQQQKFRNTLRHWLINTQTNDSAEENGESENDGDITDDGAGQSSSAQVLNSHSEDQAAESDMDEETQLLMPQELEGDISMSQASTDMANGEAVQNHNHDGLDKGDVSPATSVGLVKHKTKITDFFSGISSSHPAVKRARVEQFPEKQDDDNDIIAEVSWLGTPITELKRMPECGGWLCPLRDVPDQHTVMIMVCFCSHVFKCFSELKHIHINILVITTIFFASFCQ